MRRTAALALSLALVAWPAAAPASDRVSATFSAGACKGATSAAPGDATLPRLTGRVVDEAHILSAPARASLTRRLARLEAATSDQLVVVTLPDLRGRTIEAWGRALGNGWRIGRRGLDNGVLLVVAPNDRKVRIEVGCGLEGLLTPARSAAIVRDPLLPLLKASRYDAAAEAGVARIAAVLARDTRRPQPPREARR